MRPVLSWACVVLLGTATSPVGAADKEVKLSAAERKVVDLVNQARARARLSAVKPCAALGVAARGHAAVMARKGELKQSFDGKQPVEQLKAAGYEASQCGSLICVGTNDPAAIFGALLAEKTCREEVLSREVTEVGVGIVEDGKGKVYYNIVLAKPK